MKTRVVSKRTGDGRMAPSAKVRGPTTAESPVSHSEAEATDDGDGFEEVPTVANRANPTSGVTTAPEAPSSSSGTPADAGAYHILRPGISDSMDTPTTAKSKPEVAGRQVIGSTRKRR